VSVPVPLPVPVCMWPSPPTLYPLEHIPLLPSGHFIASLVTLPFEPQTRMDQHKLVNCKLLISSHLR